MDSLMLKRLRKAVLNCLYSYLHILLTSHDSDVNISLLLKKKMKNEMQIQYFNPLNPSPYIELCLQSVAKSFYLV